MTLPRFRKRCLNAYPLRRERSQNFDNKSIPNFWGNLPLPPLIWRETWQSYAANDPISVANTGGNWTQTSSELHTNPLAQLGTPAGQVNFGMSGFNGFANRWSGPSNLGQANRGIVFGIQVQIKGLTPGRALDGGNNHLWTLGTQNGLSYQNDSTNGVQLIHYADGLQKALYNKGFNANYSATITVIVNVNTSDLYEGNTKLGTVAVTPEVAGFNSLQLISGLAGGALTGVGIALGTVSLYGTHP